MNNYDLFDAMGGIDEELLERSERRAVRKTPLRKLLIAAAAVALMAVTVLAAPLIAELIYHFRAEQTIYGATLPAMDGSMITYNNMHMIHFDVDDPETLPTSIEEYCIPHYAVDQGWTFNGGYLYTRDFGESTNIFWINEAVPWQWVEFEQASINQFADWVDQEPGTNHFYIASGEGATVTETTISTGLGDIPAYEVEGGYIDQLHVFWSDGTYAFHIITDAIIDPEVLASLIQSVGPVEDPAPYLVDTGRVITESAQTLPEGDSMTFSTVPDGYELTECRADGSKIDWSWFKDNDNYIQLVQAASGYSDPIIHQYNLQNIPHTLETMELDGTTVYFITGEDHIAAAWSKDGFDFIASWSAEEPLAWEQMASLISTLEPVDNLSAYITDTNS